MTTPLEAVLADPVVHATYLLYAGERGLPEAAPDTLAQFCCWLIVSGRHDMAHPAVIPRSVVEALTLPDRDGTHALMAFVARAQSHPPRADELPGFYYTRAVPALGLGRFIGARERHSLARAVPDPRDPLQDDLAFLRELAGNPSPPNCPSISIIGFHRSVLGIGEDARCLFRALLTAGISAELIDVSPAVLERSDEIEAYRAFEAAKPSGEILIFCMPPFEMMRAIARLALEAGRPRQYRIGYWPWETTALRDDWLLAADHVDEIWAMSRFLEATYQSQCPAKPVIYMPPCVEQPEPRVPDDLATIFGGDFGFLSIFDFNSRIERKNPLGLISAFRSAFPHGSERVRLILKTLNQDKHPEHFAAVMEAIGADDRILVVDGPLHQDELNGLMSLADAYVSLHRSEGFGRTLAEAMRLRIPVVATGWSGPADFLDETTGYPIRSTLSPVRAPDYPFAAGQWADPDLDQAAAALRDIAERRTQARTKIETAHSRIAAQYSRTTVANLLRSRLELIGAVDPRKDRASRSGSTSA
ncbi:glycosyltransferase [Bradyrhizobium sp. HKCCYLS20291]|uniref:glycosyltransferase n=1 Tax=Bradyrhizobium sp. HKCCYLS20291 TaxID=3420766 RepID=UPI003EBD9263